MCFQEGTQSHIGDLLYSRWLSGKESTCQCRIHSSRELNPRVGKIYWSSKWQPTPVFLPKKFHGQRSLAGYSPWGCRSTHNWACTHMLYFRISSFRTLITNANPLHLCHILLATSKSQGRIYEVPPKVCPPQYIYCSISLCILLALPCNVNSLTTFYYMDGPWVNQCFIIRHWKNVNTEVYSFFLLQTMLERMPLY